MINNLDVQSLKVEYSMRGFGYGSSGRFGSLSRQSFQIFILIIKLFYKLEDLLSTIHFLLHLCFVSFRIGIFMQCCVSVTRLVFVVNLSGLGIMNVSVCRI